MHKQSQNKALYAVDGVFAHVDEYECVVSWIFGWAIDHMMIESTIPQTQSNHTTEANFLHVLTSYWLSSN